MELSKPETPLQYVYLICQNMDCFFFPETGMVIPPLIGMICPQDSHSGMNPLAVLPMDSLTFLA